MAPTNDQQTAHIPYPAAEFPPDAPSQAPDALCHATLIAYTCHHALAASLCFSQHGVHDHDPAAAKLGTRWASACPSCKADELKRQLANLHEAMAEQAGALKGPRKAAEKVWWELAAARRERDGISAKGGVVRLDLAEVKGNVIWEENDLRVKG